jgi:hypothetical protein
MSAPAFSILFCACGSQRVDLSGWTGPGAPVFKCCDCGHSGSAPGFTVGRVDPPIATERALEAARADRMVFGGVYVRCTGCPAIYSREAFEELAPPPAGATWPADFMDDAPAVRNCAYCPTTITAPEEGS